MQLQIDNIFVRELPGDIEGINMPRPVLNACYSRVLPQRISAPKLIAYSQEVAESLGLTCSDIADDMFVRVFSGQSLLPGMEPYAMCYGGHQFGHWAGQLGDGRAMTLCEAYDRSGVAQSLQLKGAGPTPYSRRADGLAVLRSSLREFLCSEAMHHLGIPTTRALSLVLTGDSVVRDMFYDGRPRAEPGAIVCRVAPSFLRFGNYQLFASRGDVATLRTLVDFTISRYFAHLGEPSRATYLAWFAEVTRRTIAMVVDWQRVGFVHGVMNTDNMSILGLTIDYGPYGWLENIDTMWTPNTTDANGRRYCYGNQPDIALWNLVQLANALVVLVDGVDELQAILTDAQQNLAHSLQAMWAGKLGLTRPEAGDESLIADLQTVYAQCEIDMTIFYRALAHFTKVDVECHDDELFARVAHAVYADTAAPQAHDHPALTAWLRRYVFRLSGEVRGDVERRAAMNLQNPAFVLRNYLVQLAIDAAEEGRDEQIFALLNASRAPYDEHGIPAEFIKKRPDWARQRAGCSMLSCSS